MTGDKNQPPLLTWILEKSKPLNAQEEARRAKKTFYWGEDAQKPNIMINAQEKKQIRQAIFTRGIKKFQIG